MEKFVIGKKYRTLDNEAARVYCIADLAGQEFIANEVNVCPSSGDECAFVYFESEDLNLHVPFEAVEAV